MRTFLTRLAFFSIPFWVLLGWLYLVPYPHRYAFNQIQKDCRSGLWIYRRLHENPKPLDIALVGTSRTMCALEDEFIQSQVSDSGSAPLHVSNLGVCRNGVDLHAFLVNELLDMKKPKAIVVEIHTVMPPNSHMHFPMVADAKDVIHRESFLNSSYFQDISTMTWTRLCFLRERALGIRYSFPEEILNPDFSFVSVPNDITADAGEMDKTRTRRQNITETRSGLSGRVTDLQSLFPKAYYESMAEACKSAQVPLYFLYLPGYGTTAKRPQDYDFYASLAPVLLPPDSIFRNPQHFFDPDHLNQKGARMLSIWLSNEIRQWK